MKTEKEFLELLESRAREEKIIANSGILPPWATKLGEWFGIDPWRPIVPIAIFCYMGLRITSGTVITEIVLAIFGGFRW